MHSYSVSLKTKRPVRGNKDFFYPGVVAKNSKHAVAKATTNLTSSTKNKVVVVEIETKQNY